MCMLNYFCVLWFSDLPPTPFPRPRQINLHQQKISALVQSIQFQIFQVILASMVPYSRVKLKSTHDKASHYINILVPIDFHSNILLGVLLSFIRIT